MRRALIAMALCYGLVYGGVVASGQWTFHRGKALTVPFAPGHAIVVEVWPLALLAERYNPYSRAFLYFNPESRDARWIAIWHEDTAAGTWKRLGVFTLPTWPLAVSTASLWLTLAAVVFARRSSRDVGRKSKWEIR